VGPAPEGGAEWAAAAAGLLVTGVGPGTGGVTTAGFMTGGFTTGGLAKDGVGTAGGVYGALLTGGTLGFLASGFFVVFLAKTFLTGAFLAADFFFAVFLAAVFFFALFFFAPFFVAAVLRPVVRFAGPLRAAVLRAALRFLPGDLRLLLRPMTAAAALPARLIAEVAAFLIFFNALAAPEPREDFLDFLAISSSSFASTGGASHLYTTDCADSNKTRAGGAFPLTFLFHTRVLAPFGAGTHVI